MAVLTPQASSKRADHLVTGVALREVAVQWMDGRFRRRQPENQPAAAATEHRHA
jgi:hypothetical protein